MKWSVSASKAFLQCLKKWYYHSVFASSRAGDSERREAYFLKKLQSIHAWRGKLVDQVITKHIVPRMNKRQEIDVPELLKYANMLMDAQLAFAKSGKYRDLGVRTGDITYCALLELENGGSLSEESINQIRDQMNEALINFLYIKRRK